MNATDRLAETTTPTQSECKKRGKNMLPDFLKTKEKLKGMITSERKKAQLRHMGPFAEIPQSNLIEGNKVLYIDEDGSSEEVTMEKAEVKIEIKLDEIEEMTHERVINKIDTMERDMAKKISNSAYELMSEAAKEAGNVISSAGKPISVCLLLEMIQDMHLSFDEEGQASGLTFAGNPKLSPSLEEVILQFKTDPRYRKLMEQKREEWRVRESRRKLVG